MPAGAVCPSHSLMAVLLQVNISGTMAQRRIARKRCYACWCCLSVAHADGSTAVGEHNLHDWMAPYRSKEMLCLLVLLGIAVGQRIRHEAWRLQQTAALPLKPPLTLATPIGCTTVLG